MAGIVGTEGTRGLTWMAFRSLFGKHPSQLFDWLLALGGSPWLLGLEGKS